MASEVSCSHKYPLLGKQCGKYILDLLPLLESLVSMQDQRLNECLCLLATRFPNGFDGQVPFWSLAKIGYYQVARYDFGAWQILS